MLAYAAHQFELAEKQPDGTSLLDHLQSIYRQSGHMPEQLLGPQCPEEVMYVWEYFCDMNKRRTSNGFGNNPISALELEAWERHRGIRLFPFEHAALDALEVLYLTPKDKKHD